MRVAKDAAVLPDAAFTRQGASIAGKALSGLVDAKRLFALFDEGATVVLQGLHRYWPPLTALVAELELELGHPCQANAYLTPPGNQGFAVHSDAHDVFVFQTYGTKLWEVHQPIPEGRQREEILLEPGLSMYLPTGTPHAARAQAGASLHVTLGINQLTWRGAVRRAVERVLAAVPDEHLPAGYVDDPALLSGPLADRLDEVAAAISALDAETAAEAEVRRFLTSRPTRQGGGLVDVLAVRDLAADTPLRRRVGHPCVLTAGPDPARLTVLLGDRSLTVPARLRAALEHVRAAAEFTPSDLPLDPESAVVLARRLVREGLLEVAR